MKGLGGWGSSDIKSLLNLGNPWQWSRMISVFAGQNKSDCHVLDFPSSKKINVNKVRVRAAHNKPIGSVLFLPHVSWPAAWSVFVQGDDRADKHNHSGHHPKPQRHQFWGVLVLEPHPNRQRIAIYVKPPAKPSQHRKKKHDSSVPLRFLAKILGVSIYYGNTQ